MYLLNYPRTSAINRSIIENNDGLVSQSMNHSISRIMMETQEYIYQNDHHFALILRFHLNSNKLVH